MYTYVQLVNITWPTLMAPKSAVQRVERWLIRGPCSNWCPEQVPCIIERLVVVLCFAVALSIMHIVTVTICLSKTHLIKYVHSLKTPRLPDCELPEYATGSSGKTVSHLEAKTFGNLPTRSDRSFCNGHFEAVGYMAKQPSGKSHWKQISLTYGWFDVVWK